MGITIVDLPAEVLHEVFSSFRSDFITDVSPGKFGWRFGVGNGGPADPASIKSARLACRRLNEAASPFLLPCVTVGVDQRSLDLVGSIVRNPPIASGVHAVKVELSCYPLDACADLPGFMGLQMSDIQNSENYLHYGNYAMDDDHMNAVIQGRISSILESWNNDTDIGGTSADSTTASESPNYRAILLDAYAEFRARSSEQTCLLDTGSFARSLGSLIPRLPRFGALYFNDDLDTLRDGHDPLKTFFEPELLMGFLTSPYNVHGAECRNPPEILQFATASLLRDLPVAIHEARGTIRALSISCFPEIPRNISFVDLVGQEDRLRDAFRDLENVNIYSVSRTRHHDDGTLDPDGAGGTENRYLAAAVSAPSLSKIDFHWRFQWRLELYQARSRLYTASTVLAAFTSERITQLFLRNVSVSESELVDVLRRLSSPTRVYLNEIMLTRGSWGPVVEELKKKTAARYAEGRCDVRVHECGGVLYPFGPKAYPPEELA